MSFCIINDAPFSKCSQYKIYNFVSRLIISHYNRVSRLHKSRSIIYTYISAHIHTGYIQTCTGACKTYWQRRKHLSTLLRSSGTRHVHYCNAVRSHNNVIAHVANLISNTKLHDNLHRLGLNAFAFDLSPLMLAKSSLYHLTR